MFRRNKHSETSQRFSIKKYSFGVASALVGVFFAAGANYAQADNSTPQRPAAPVVSVAQTPAPAASVATPAPVTQTPAAQPATQVQTPAAPVAQTTTQAPSTSAPVAQTTTPAPNATTTANPTVQKEADKKAEEKTKAEVKAAQTRVTPKWTANTVTEITAEIKRQEKEELKEYVVQWGDTLNRISKATGTSVADLVRYNNIKNPNKIFVGDLLKNVLYVTPSNLDPRNQTDPRNRGQQNGRRSWIANSVEEIRNEIDAQTKANNANYVIQWGDTLSRISKASGKSIKELQTLNNIKNINKIYAGKELKGVLVPTNTFNIDELYKKIEELESKDTDADGLNDYIESYVTYTDPNDLSSNDLLKDVDNDGLTIQEELNVYNTKPAFYDSDYDWLNDGDEVKVHKTSPLNNDTDGDGARDGWEIKNGYNPLVKDSTFKNIEDTVALDNGMGAKVTTELNGDQVETLAISRGYHPLFDEKMPGVLGPLLSLDVKNNINKPAKLSIQFNPDILSNGIEPAIFYLNENTKKLEELKTTISNGWASADLNHFSYYALYNKKQDYYATPSKEGVTVDISKYNPVADPNVDDDGDGFLNSEEIGQDMFHFDHNIVDNNKNRMNLGSKIIGWDFFKPDYRKWNVGPRDLAFFATLAYNDKRFEEDAIGKDDNKRRFSEKMYDYNLSQNNQFNGKMYNYTVLENEIKDSNKELVKRIEDSFNEYKEEAKKLIDNKLGEWKEITLDFANIQMLTPNNTQFNVHVYKNKNSSQAVLAFRGTDDEVNGVRTEENKSRELKEGALNILRGTNPQSEFARLFIYNNLDKLKKFSDIYITGHSLGGHLAYQAASEAVEYISDKIKGVINFSGPGFATKSHMKDPDPRKVHNVLGKTSDADFDEKRNDKLQNSPIQIKTLLPYYDDWSFEWDEDHNDIIVWGGGTKHPHDPIIINRYDIEDSHSMIHFLKQINQGYRGQKNDVKSGINERPLHPGAYDAFTKILNEKDNYLGFFDHETRYMIKKGENDHLLILGKHRDGNDRIIRYFTYDKDKKEIITYDYVNGYIGGRQHVAENINNVNKLYHFARSGGLYEGTNEKLIGKHVTYVGRQEVNFEGKVITLSNWESKVVGDETQIPFPNDVKEVDYLAWPFVDDRTLIDNANKSQTV